MHQAAEVHEAYDVLVAGESAAAKMSRLTGAAAWARWLEVGRAVEFLHSLHPSPRGQGAIIARYPNLKSISTVIRSNAKWVWQNRSELEALAREGRVTLGHPTTVREAYNRLRRSAAQLPDRQGLETLRRDVTLYVTRNHNSPDVLVDLLIQLAGASEDGRGDSLLRAALRKSTP